MVNTQINDMLKMGGGDFGVEMKMKWMGIMW